MPIMRPIAVRLAVITALAWSLACSAGPAKRPVINSPIGLVTGNTRPPVAKYLVVPRYTLSSGVSSGGGHGPGSMSHRVFVAHPFLYEPGDTFRPYEGDASGLYVFGAWAGKAVPLDGVTVIAPGYQSLWIWDLWSREESTAYELVALSDSGALIELKEIQELLGRSTIDGEDRRRWSYAGEGPIAVQFSEEEREIVLRFIQNGIDAIGGSDG